MRTIICFLSIICFLPTLAFSWTYETWNLGGGPYNNEVRGIAMTSPTDGWAVIDQGYVYHWDGNQWSYYDDIGGAGYKGMEYFDPNHIYAYGATSLNFYNGSYWDYFSPSPPTGCLGLQVLSPDDIWAAGTSDIANLSTSILHWNGSEWQYWNDPPGFEDSIVYCVGFGSSDEGWAGGITGAMSHYYDGEWHAYTPLTSLWLRCADFANPNYGMMAGDGVRLFYLSGVWEANETGLYFTDCYCINDQFTAAVVEEGVTLVYHYGTLYSVGGTGEVSLYSVFALSPYDIWAGGEDGFVCHWTYSDEVQPTSLGNIKAMFAGEGQPQKLETKNHFFAPQNPLIYGGQHSP
jgi:hypothetical protein